MGLERHLPPAARPQPGCLQRPVLRPTGPGPALHFPSLRVPVLSSPARQRLPVQRRTFSVSFRNKEAVQGQEASWKNKTLAETCWVPTLGGVCRLRKPRPCLITAKKSKSAIGGEGAVHVPRAGLSSSCYICLCPELPEEAAKAPFIWRVSGLRVTVHPRQEVQVAQNGLTATLAFTAAFPTLRPHLSRLLRASMRASFFAL